MAGHVSLVDGATVNRYPFPLPTRPGLGVGFDEDAIADHPHSLADMPHFHKPDGSHTNWQAAVAKRLNKLTQRSRHPGNQVIHMPFLHRQ